MLSPYANDALWLFVTQHYCGNSYLIQPPPHDPTRIVSRRLENERGRRAFLHSISYTSFKPKELKEAW